jgi:hypothetical protein
MTSLPIAATLQPLARYDAACRAVAEASTVDDVQHITAQAEAVRAYARQAKNRQLEIDAAEIRIRAERRLGELMAAQAETVGKAKGGWKSRGLEENPQDTPTLAEAGIDKNLAHRARTLAAVPAEKFAELLDDKRARGNRRVVLDPDFEAEAEAAARDIEIERDERIALAGADALAAENASLGREVEMLRQRVAALVEEIATLKYRVKMWKGRAEKGWSPPAAPTPVERGQRNA